MPKTGLYVPLDVGFIDDDKIEEVGLDGAGLYAMSLALAKRTMTNGRLTRTKLRRLGADDELIDRCIEVGLYREDDAGVWIAAWLGHNESTDRIEERRARDAARKRQTRANAPLGHPPDSTGSPAGIQSDVRTQGSRGKTEGQEREVPVSRNGRAKPKVAAPDPFKITDDMRTWARDRCITVELERETEKFLNHHRSKGNKFVDWWSAWRNWITKAQEYHDRDNPSVGTAPREF